MSKEGLLKNGIEHEKGKPLYENLFKKIEVLNDKIQTISVVCDMCLNNGMGKEKSLKYIKKLLDIKDWKVKCCNGCSHNVLTEDEEYYCDVGCEPIDNWCLVRDEEKEKKMK